VARHRVARLRLRRPSGRRPWSPWACGSEGFDVAPGGGEIWVANARDGTVSVVDVAAKKVVATLAANVRGANRLKFTPDGKLVLISCLGGSDLVVLDAAAPRSPTRETGQRRRWNSNGPRRIARVRGLHAG
jgi:YVTN family beta-propeller protein